MFTSYIVGMYCSFVVVLRRSGRHQPRSTKMTLDEFDPREIAGELVADRIALSERLFEPPPNRGLRAPRRRQNMACHTHTHTPSRTQTACWSGCVAPSRVGCSGAAHGCVTLTDMCECGASRRREVNQCYEVAGVWEVPLAGGRPVEPLVGIWEGGGGGHSPAASQQDGDAIRFPVPQEEAKSLDARRLTTAVAFWERMGGYLPSADPKGWVYSWDDATGEILISVFDPGTGLKYSAKSQTHGPSGPSEETRK